MAKSAKPTAKKPAQNQKVAEPKSAEQTESASTVSTRKVTPTPKGFRVTVQEGTVKYFDGFVNVKTVQQALEIAEVREAIDKHGTQKDKNGKTKPAGYMIVKVYDQDGKSLYHARR